MAKKDSGHARAGRDLQADRDRRRGAAEPSAGAGVRAKF
jgi:hypothetical protein